jgi:hypothetical protein
LDLALRAFFGLAPHAHPRVAGTDPKQAGTRRAQDLDYDVGFVGAQLCERLLDCFVD